ncbi:choline/ethanolamine kinase family protein [Arcobacter ellisii]|uniref:Choline kinase n=1 Tax=Arcobacter ellisii TaxID=913109 RepID=A0A347U6Y9_9BACT|nr:choline/ethanolamine kinase family protein [Arcobacter ellisii]AXX94617.1 choline kinase [Arcobacter ellisii]RXI29236.1 choline kinase [Arcobacter ellisii]
MNIEELEKYNIFEEKLLSLELLKNQGFNNISYLLKTSENSYVIRVFKSNSSVNISREFEFQIQKLAYKKDICSKPIFLNDKFMVYEYKKGSHKTKLNPYELKALTCKIKKLHQIKIKTKPYDIKKDLLNYKKVLENEKLIQETFKNLNLLKKYKKELVLSHHDLNPKNIIFNNKDIKIIDWEYVGTNDRFFDLASICIEFSLNKKEEEFLLKTYFKFIKKTHLKKLESYKIVYKNLCSLWFINYLRPITAD